MNVKPKNSIGKIMVKKIFLLFLISQISFSNYKIFASDNDDKPNDKDKPKAELATAATNNVGYTAVMDIKKQAELNAHLKNFNVGVHYRPAVKVDKMEDITGFVSAAAAEGKQDASKLFRFLDAKGDYKAEGQPLEDSDLLKLPIGLKKQFGNTTADVGILSAQFYASYAEITVFVRLRTNVTDGSSANPEKELFFGAKNVRFSKATGLTQFKAVLLGDVPLNFGNYTVTLQGGLDIATGDVANDTYVQVNCGLFEEAKLTADIVFPESQLVQLEDNYEQAPLGERVTGRFTATITRSFNDILASVSFPNGKFALASNPKMGFGIRSATIDLSDFQNPNLATFPPEMGVPPPSWRGLYIAQLDFALPKEFKDKTATTPGRLVQTINNLVYDQNGFSANVNLNYPILTLDNGDMSGWAYSLTNFHFTIVQNDLKEAGFGGKIRLPISQTAGTELNYTGTFNSTGFNFDVGLNNNLKFDAVSAKITLEKGSEINVSSVGGNFVPLANLNGNINFYADILGADKGDDEENADVKFRGIAFTNLKLQTTSPYLEFGKVVYENSTAKLANFPIALNRLGIENNGTSYQLIVGATISLMSESISGGTSVKFNFNYLNGAFVPASPRIAFETIKVSADLSNFSIYGEVAIKNETGVKGFCGGLTLDIKNPEINACASGGFFSDNAGFRYWYVDAKAAGFLAPIGGAVAINSIGAAVYYHMKPEAATNTFSCPSCNNTPGNTIRYVLDPGISLGFKGIVGFQTFNPATRTETDAATGMAGLEMQFGADKGLLFVGLFGEIVLGKSVIFDDNVKNQKFANLLNPATMNTIPPSNGVFTQEQLNQKAATQFGSTPGADESNPASGPIRATVGLMYVTSTRTFNGNAEVFVNINNVLTGIGANNSAGKIEIKISDDDWYIYVGNSRARNTRIGLRLTGGDIFQAEATAYFMIGHGIPDLPCPPQAILTAFGKTCPNTVPGDATAQDLKDGKGIAFGADFNVHIEAPLVVAKMTVDGGLGFDVLMKTYPGSSLCGGNFGLGANHWYASGQVFGYLQATVSTLGFEIAQGGIYAYLKAGAPKPFGAIADFKVEISLLGFDVADLSFSQNFGNICALN